MYGIFDCNFATTVKNTVYEAVHRKDKVLLLDIFRYLIGKIFISEISYTPMTV